MMRSRTVCKRLLSIFLVIVMLCSTAALFALTSTARDLLYGDVNSDEAINKKDSLALKKYLADSSYQIDKEAADVYYDGAVNKKDSLRLKQYLAGWNVVLGPEGQAGPVKPGDIVAFGQYEQDNVRENGTEPIEWQVLDVQNGLALLLSRYVLDCQPYNETDENVTWATCSLRSWLNNDFYNVAFNDAQKVKVGAATIGNPDNPAHGTDGGNGTNDRVYLLSALDAINPAYGFSDEAYTEDGARICIATPYAQARGCWASEAGAGSCYWWTRTPGIDGKSVTCVTDDGFMDTYGQSAATDDNGVRPVIWVLVDALASPSLPETLKKGDIYTFGAYEQDNKTGNGKEKIEWIVLDVKNGRALLLSKYALDCKMYNTDLRDATWQDCSLRAWLNGHFYDTAFSAAEQAKIVSTSLKNPDNPEYGTDGGSSTTDKVFVLSYEEALNTGYGFSGSMYVVDEMRICEATKYAVAQGCYLANDGEEYDGYCDWWLRTPGVTAECAMAVLNQGALYETGFEVDFDLNGVRPAIWVEI